MLSPRRKAQLGLCATGLVLVSTLGVLFASTIGTQSAEDRLSPVSGQQAPLVGNEGSSHHPVILPMSLSAATGQAH
jgi:hypothetical protein